MDDGSGRRSFGKRGGPGNGEWKRGHITKGEGGKSFMTAMIISVDQEAPLIKSGRDCLCRNRE